MNLNQLFQAACRTLLLFVTVCVFTHWSMYTFVLAADRSPEEFLKEVRSKYKNLKTFRCNYIKKNSEDASLKGPETQMPPHIQSAIGNFKKVMRNEEAVIEGVGFTRLRFEAILLNGHRAIRASDGEGYWRYETYGKDVVRYLDAAYMERLPLPFIEGLVRGGGLVSEEAVSDVVKKVTWKGADQVSHRDVSVIILGNSVLWVDIETGLVLKREQHFFPDAKSAEEVMLGDFKDGTLKPVLSESFEDCEIDIEIAPERFEFDPPKGMTVKTVTFVDGKRTEADKEIPFPEYPFGKSENAKAVSVINKLKEQFSKVKDFTGRFSHTYVMDHQSGAAGGAIVTPRENGDGELRFKAPDLFTYRYELLSGFGGPPERGYYVSNGKHIWRDAEREGMPRIVVKQTKGLFKKILKDFELASQEEVDNVGGYLRDRNHEFVPDFIASFYSSLPMKSLKYVGEEKVRDVEVEHLTAEMGQNHVTTDYWIGKADGIPRKVVEFRWRTDEVKGTYELEDVQVNAGLADKDFVFEPEDESVQVTDLDAELPRMKNAFKNTFDTPPEKIFTSMFTTPLHQVKDLRGTGKMWMTYDLRIRFYAEKMPEFRPEREVQLEDVDPGEPVGYFVLHFPEDKPSLLGPIQPESKEFHSGKNHIWMVYNPTTDIYFLRVWGDE